MLLLCYYQSNFSSSSVWTPTATVFGLIQVTKYPVAPDTEDPEYAERDKVASERRQDKGIALADKKKIFWLQSDGGKGEGMEKKRGSIDAAMNCRRCWVRTKEKCSLLGCHEDLVNWILCLPLGNEAFQANCFAWIRFIISLATQLAGGRLAWY